MIRTNCVICNQTLENKIDTFSNMPIKMSSTLDAHHNDVHVDQIYMLCKSCGCIQLKNLVDPTVLYDGKEYHAPGTVGLMWTLHHKAFAEFIAKYSPRTILEVGAGNTRLYKLLTQIADLQEYIIIDPNIDDEPSDNLTIIQDIFDTNFANKLPSIDTIVHSHTMEHFYEVVADTKKLADHLSVGGKMIISVPLIDKLIADGHTNNLNWEHTYLTTEKNIQFILQSSGLKIIEMVNHTPYNLFICAEKVDQIEIPLLVNETEYTSLLWKNYKQKIAEDILLINSTISQKSSPTFLFGAHISTQVLFANGLDERNFVAIFDNSTFKQNKRLYGTRLFVLSPYVLNHIDSARVIVRAGQYSKEIIEQLSQKFTSIQII